MARSLAAFATVLVCTLPVFADSITLSKATLNPDKTVSYNGTFDTLNYVSIWLEVYDGKDWRQVSAPANFNPFNKTYNGTSVPFDIPGKWKVRALLTSKIGGVDTPTPSNEITINVP